MNENMDLINVTIELSLDSTREELSKRCACLANDLQRISQKLSGDGSHSSILLNSLGEIQGQGGIIDSLCGKFCALENLHRLVDTFRE